MRQTQPFTIPLLAAIAFAAPLSSVAVASVEIPVPRTDPCHEEASKLCDYPTTSKEFMMCYHDKYYKCLMRRQAEART